MSTKKTTQRDVFKPGEFIVYPPMAWAKVTAIEEQEIAGFKLELFVVNFTKEKMTLRVPVAKAASVGMRKLSEASVLPRRWMFSPAVRASSARCGAAAPRNMKRRSIRATSSLWPRSCAYLYRSEAQPEQSYSERQLFETALARLVDEIAAVDGSTRDRSDEAR